MSVPSDYRIARSERVVYARAWGVFTNDELADTRAALETMTRRDGRSGPLAHP